MTTGLTPLERELLSYVNALTQASEQSVRALRDLEARSTNQMAARLNAIEDGMTRLTASQLALTEVLSGYMSESKTFAELADHLRRSKQALNEIEARLKRVSHR